MIWKPVTDKFKYGVVLQKFEQNAEWCVQLQVGNTVHILEESAEWYYGYVQPNRQVCGIFPKSFIYIKECIVDRTQKVETVTPRMPPIIQELTADLKEWGPLLNQLYTSGNKHFNVVYDKMMQLIADRKTMLSGKLPTTEMKQIKHGITSNIDVVNKLLGLDLVARDENGNILNPDITSTIKLFRHHEEATEIFNNVNIEDSLSCSGKVIESKPHTLWTLRMDVTNIILKVPDPCEVSLGLYVLEGQDCRDMRPEIKETPLTESYLFTWTPSGYNEHSYLYSSLRCCFTDLGSNMFMSNERPVYIMGSVVREGGMATKENERWSSTLTLKKPISSNSIRRPYGVFVAEISSRLKQLRDDFVSNTAPQTTSEICAQFIPCGEKDTFESVFRRFIHYPSETSRDKNSSTLGIWLALTLLNGDMKQITTEHPLLSADLKDVSVGYRLGLSDLSTPDDIRNDLYVTLLGGEFCRERNVEVVARVCDEHGRMIPGVLHVGFGKGARDEYRSVTYHHEGKPRWMETFKVALPIEEFRKAHLKFLFKHRSTNELKDKSERPFAMSFVNLMQPNGTTLLNIEHELLVYKVDPKRYNEESACYLKFPCVKRLGEEISKVREEGFTLNLKDSFTISSLFCSTKLTQNAELLSLLEWGASGSNCKTDLKRHVAELRKVPADELTIFLQDTLDVLFEILVKRSKDPDSDMLVFTALVDVLDFAATQQKKYENYHVALDNYIEKNFSATLAYEKLICVFQALIKTPPTNTTLNKAMKCLYYIIKLICKSWLLFYELYAQGRTEFEESLEDLLISMGGLMSRKELTLLTVQEQCLKHISRAIPDLMTRIDHIKLSRLLISIVLQGHRLSPRRLTAMNSICHSKLFLEPPCRKILLHAFLGHMKSLFAQNDDVANDVAIKKGKTIEKLLGIALSEVEGQGPADEKKMEEQKQLKLSVQNMSDILDILFSSEVGNSDEDILKITSEVLQDIMAIISKMSKEDELMVSFVTIFISILRQISMKDYLEFAKSFDTSALINFQNDILVVIQGLIKDPVFPSDWSEMLFLQNHVFMKIIRLSSEILIDELFEPFIEKSWIHFLQCIVQFITQPCLQLETYSLTKRNQIVNRYKDLRKKASLTLVTMWQSLGVHQLRFVGRKGNRYSLVRPFLEVTMLSVVDVRYNTIPIFFEMMQCEYYSPKDKPGTEEKVIKSKFNVFESEMLEQLDSLVEEGKGDEHYREVFVNILTAKCKENPSMADQALKFVKTTGVLMEHLLQYRSIMSSSEYSSEIKMACTVNLLGFYASINRKELYIRYVYKLYDLHMECKNYTEAGYTLKYHADLLKWHHDLLPEALRPSRYPHLRYHDKLKEDLYNRIICNFCEGKMWMAAVQLCKELIQRHEEVTLDYMKVSKLHSDMAGYYRNLMNLESIGTRPEYFRVAYYGRGFPAFLQNKVFVYRGNDYEKLVEFQSRILDQFQNAELMKNLSPPSQEQKDSAHQYIQINNLTPETKATKYMEGSVAENIRRYYMYNHIDTFSYSRPFHRGERDKENEFKTLWTEKTTLKTTLELPGLIKCFAVVNEKAVELSPLKNAIDTMASANEEVQSLIKRFVRESPGSLDILTRKLSGMVDAAVMGGTKNYEKAFLTREYEENNLEDAMSIAHLKELIRSQVPLLELALDIHGCLVPDAYVALHTHLIESFHKMKAHIQTEYGVSEMPMDLEAEVRNMKRRQRSSTEMDRSSHYSIGTESTASFLRSSASSKGNMSTLPRGLKLTSGTTPVYRKERKDKKLRYILRRDSVSNSPKNSTFWFERPDSGIFVGENITESKKTLSASQNFDPPSSITSKISSALSLNSLDRLEPTPATDTFESSSPFAEDFPDVSNRYPSPVPEADIPPPLPIKTKSHESHVFTSRCSQIPIDEEAETSEPPEKPPRPDLLPKRNRKFM